MNDRCIKVYDILFDVDDYISAKVLASMVGVTPKTIYLDARKLEEACKDLGLIIDRRPNRGLKLKGSLEAKQKFKNKLHNKEKMETDFYSLDERRKQLFIELILEGKSVSLQEFSERYYVSKTAILNDIDYFEKYLSVHRVTIATINKRFEFIGEEQGIQSAIADYFMKQSLVSIYDTESELKDYFGNTVYSVMRTICFEDNLIDFSRMNDYYTESLFCNLLIFAYRTMNNHHITPGNYSNMTDQKGHESYSLACDLGNIMTQRMNIHFKNQDIDVLSNILFAHKAYPIKVENQSWGTVVDEIIERFEHIADVVLDDSDELRGQLLSHLPPMVLRLRRGMQITNPLLGEIKKKHLPLFTTSWYVLSALEPKYNIVLNDDEVAFITIFFQVALNKTIPINKIIIACPYGAVSSQFILRKLRQILPKNDDITTCSVSQLKRMNLSDISLVITTSDIYIDASIPHVQVSPFLGNEDYAKIFEAYANYIYRKQEFVKSTMDLHQMEFTTLNKYLRAEDIFFKMRFPNKESCLNYMIDHFEKNGYVQEEFRSSVFEREKIGNTALENNVAIPHAKPELCNQLAIGIMTLTEPVRWMKGYDVDLIILISVPQRMENEFGSIVLDVYHLIEQTDVVANIKKLNNGEELIEVIR